MIIVINFIIALILLSVCLRIRNIIFKNEKKWVSCFLTIGLFFISFFMVHHFVTPVVEEKFSKSAGGQSEIETLKTMKFGSNKTLGTQLGEYLPKYSFFRNDKGRFISAEITNNDNHKQKICFVFEVETQGDYLKARFVEAWVTKDGYSSYESVSPTSIQGIINKFFGKNEQELSE